VVTDLSIRIPYREAVPTQSPGLASFGDNPGSHALSDFNRNAVASAEDLD